MKNYLATVVIIIALLFTGCSNGGGGTPVVPEQPVARNQQSHSLMGLWQFEASPERGTLEFEPIRMAEMHVNVLPFLEPPPLFNLTLESVEFNGNLIFTQANILIPLP